MKLDFEHAESGKLYAQAYAAHYKEKDLQNALELYQKIMNLYPNDQEAGFSRAQIANIIKSVVPEQDLMDAQVKLALELLKS